MFKFSHGKREINKALTGNIANLTGDLKIYLLFKKFYFFYPVILSICRLKNGKLLSGIAVWAYTFKNCSLLKVEK